MKIEIWSDVVCPFCYIGKKNLEAAIRTLPNSPNIEVEWKSFLLDPTTYFQEGMTTETMLVQKKGIPLAQVKTMLAGVIDMGEAAGIPYHFDKVLPANSVLAHRLIHLAKAKNKQNEAKEAFLKAHFVEGLNIENEAVLKQVALSVGLTDQEVESVLTTDQYQAEVESDYLEAKELNINGVPFFVFDRKYALSGAQPVEQFVQVMKEALKAQT